MTFAYNATSSWLPVHSSNCIVGCNTWATLKKGTSSTWSLNLTNNYADRNG